MSTPTLERIAFEHQEPVADHIEAGGMPPSYPQPEVGKPLTEAEQHEQDSNCAEIMDDFAKLRIRQQNIATWEKQAREKNEGPFATPPNKTVPDPANPGRFKSVPRTLDEYIALQQTVMVDPLRQGIVDKLTGMVETGNTTRLLDQLGQEVSMFANMGSDAPDAVTAQEKVVAGQRTDYHAANATLRATERGGVTVYGRHEITGHRPVRKVGETDATFEARQVAYSHQLRASRELTTASKARASLHFGNEKLENARHHDTRFNGDSYSIDDGSGNMTHYELESYADMIAGVVDEVSEKHRLHTEAAQEHVSNAANVINGWRIEDTNPTYDTADPARDAQIETELTEARNHLNELSPADEGRAEMVEAANKIRFRQEHRHILNQAKNGGGTANHAHFTDDGGIYILLQAPDPTATPPVKPEGVVLYDDGSVARREDDGRVVRRSADGSEWTQPPAVSIGDIDTSGLSNAQLEGEKDVVFQAWEQSRDPVLKQEAVAYLDANVGRVSSEANHLTRSNEQMAGRVDTINDRLTNIPGEITNLTTEATNNDRQAANVLAQGSTDGDAIQQNIDNLTGGGTKLKWSERRQVRDWEKQIIDVKRQAKEEADRLTALAASQRTEASTLHAQIPALDQERTRLRGDMARNRHEIGYLRFRENRDRYWQGVLRAEAVPPVGSPARIGHTAMSGMIEMPPHLLANGTMVWNNATINGVQGRWSMTPNREAIHYDGAFENVRDRLGQPVAAALHIPRQRANHYYAPNGQLMGSLLADGRTVRYNPDGSIASVA